MIDRDTILAHLQAELPALPGLRAAWLGGSDASGRTDRWSDIDLCLVAAAGRAAELETALLAAFERLAPLEHFWRLPMPSWHGHRQFLAALAGADPFAQLDCVVVDDGSERDRFLDRERHGAALVLHDPDGLLEPPPLDAAALVERMEARLETIRAVAPFGRALVLKALRRGHLADAATAFQGQVTRPLLEVLRMRHCPQRFDYGFRYLDRDLPDEARRLVEALCLLADGTDLEAKLALGLARLERELDALRRGDWSPRALVAGPQPD